MSEDTCWNAGYRAATRKKTIDACPFPIGWRRNAWLQGFYCAAEPYQVVRVMGQP